MEWSEGYVTDTDYPAGLFREQGPDFLNCACIFNDVEPVPTDRPYTYFELGCGRGMTLAILAASNPTGQFYGVDFKPSHIAGARELASKAGLANLTLLENSFSDLLDGTVPDLPQCDFITLHGVYTWINREHQLQVVEFLRRYLKPGGIAYVSYNAMPGWNAELPLTRLLLEHAQRNPAHSQTQLKEATSFLEQFVLEHGGFFNTTPALGQLLGMLKKHSPDYLAHEYLNRNGQPLYHLDVVRDFADAKLDFVGSADLCCPQQTLYLDPARLALLETIPDPALRETLKDFLLNTYFRRDVFVRGARRLVPTKKANWLRTMSLVLRVPRKKLQLEAVSVGVVHVNIDPVKFEDALDALSDHPCTLAELAALPSLQNETLTGIADVAAMLTMSNQAALYFARADDPAPSHRLNAVIAAEACHSDSYQSVASPLLGNGIALNPVELLVHGILQKRPLESIEVMVQEVQATLASRQRRLRKNGIALDSEEEQLAAITEHVRESTIDKLTTWHQLGLL